MIDESSVLSSAMSSSGATTAYGSSSGGSNVGSSSECTSTSINSTTEQFIICCKVCGSLNGLRRCSRCKSVYYCSQVHQQVDWRVHKIECKKFATTSTSSECLVSSFFFSWYAVAKIIDFGFVQFFNVFEIFG